MKKIMLITDRKTDGDTYGLYQKKSYNYERDVKISIRILLFCQGASFLLLIFHGKEGNGMTSVHTLQPN